MWYEGCGIHPAEWFRLPAIPKPRSLIGVYERFEVACCLHPHGTGTGY